MDTKPSSQSDQHMHDADAEYNSSEYTHSNLDPTVGDAHPDSAQSNADDQSRNHAMEAVMQLAQAASQQQYDQSEQHQQHGHVENPDVHHDSLPVNNSEQTTTEKRGDKRRTSTAGRRGSKAARQDDQEDVATAAAAAAAAAAAGGETNLPFSASWTEGNISAEIQKAYQQHLASTANFSSPSSTPATAAAAGEGGASSSTSPGSNPNNASGGSPPFKPTRQLSTSKRAAQNRAAQRAFRERRDKYVKVLESKASRLEAAVRVATECKRRYVEALQTIDGLRQDNHTLRVALAALSGTNVVAPAPQNKADDLASELPEIPKVTTEEEMEVLQSAQAGGNAGGSAMQIAGTARETGQQSLDGLSAVAAAAAAVQELGGTDKQDEGAKEGEQQADTQTQAEGDNATSTATTTTAEGKSAPPAASASTPPAATTAATAAAQ